MMKFVFVWLLFVLALLLPTRSVYADMVVLEGGPGTTPGELFEGVTNDWVTNQVVEFPGLEMRARTIDPTQALNANSGYFGINSELAGEDLRAFDVGEAMELSFDRDVRFNLMDFNLFDAGESFVIMLDGLETVTISHDDLANKSSDIYSFTVPLDVSAGTTIEFHSAAGSMGLDGIDINVIPEPASIALIAMTGFGVLMINRFKN